MDTSNWIALVGAIATVSIGGTAVYIASRQNLIAEALRSLEESRDTPNLIPGELVWDETANEIRFPLINTQGGAAVNVRIDFIAIDCEADGHFDSVIDIRVINPPIPVIVRDETVIVPFGQPLNSLLRAECRAYRVSAVVGRYYDRGRLVQLNFECHENLCSSIRAKHEIPSEDPLLFKVQLEGGGLHVFREQ